MDKIKLFRIGKILKMFQLTRTRLYQLQKELGIKPTMVKWVNPSRFYTAQDISKLTEYFNNKNL